MSDLSYHVEGENRNSKNGLKVSLVSASKKPFTKEGFLSLTSTASEKEALGLLLKEPFAQNSFFYSARSSFTLLKLLGTTGRLFYKGKKMVVDPFSCLEFFMQLETLSSDRMQLRGKWKLKNQEGFLSECEWVMATDIPWALYGGIIRCFDEDTPSKWLLNEIVLEGKALSLFLAEGVKIQWKGEPLNLLPQLHPFLVLSDRHGGFADLWFDYGTYGKVAFHDPIKASWRDLEAEKKEELDLLETDFMKKRVEESHYYCPLDKVAKSLTFLLEVGWRVVDAKGRFVVRQTALTLNPEMSATQILLKGKVQYQEHEADLKDLVGAFNRREHFVQLSSSSVALIDREEWISQGLDFTEQEIVAEGVVLKKNEFGVLVPLLKHLPKQGDVREQITRLLEGKPATLVEVDPQFQGSLFPYQQEGFKWLHFLREGGFGGLLADEMGLGKTVQMLAFFASFPQEATILIVVPTSLVFNWQREIEKFLPFFPLYRHEGKERERTFEALSKKRVIITSYALLRIDAALFTTLSFDLVVLDEAQTIKNPDSQIAQIASLLQAKNRLAITGTPVENRLEDLWSIFRFLQPDLLGERAVFNTSVALNPLALDKMRKKICPFLLRRKKEQVLSQLPPKLEQTLFVEMTEPQKILYDSWLKNTKQKITLEGGSPRRIEILEAILRLRQLCAHPHLLAPQEDLFATSGKFERLFSDLHEVMQEKRKVLVYSQFTSMLRLIEAEVKRRGWSSVYLDGSVRNREEVVRTFQEDDTVPIFLISLKAGGVGLNLTAADYVFLYDPWWNDAVEAQAIDRVHRLGKTGSVIARRYITALSIEEKILHLKTHKKALSSSFLDLDASSGGISLEELLSLLD